jgi:UDPglucose--hexose-1-phosphate uridylyltransferase
MSELRWDPLRQHWVIMARERGLRPRDFHSEPEEGEMMSCPFCYGNEGRTPHEVFAIRSAGGPDSPTWRVRVIPNKYPALRIEGEFKSHAYGPYDVMNGIGAHEVIIETPDHNRGLGDLSQTELTDVLRAYRARLQDLRRDTRFRYMVLFKNHGRLAGATLAHSHSQIIAVPLIPPVTVTELNSCRDHFLAKDRCLLCDLIDFELAEGTRVVRDFPDFVLLTPYASSFPFELRLLPKKHMHDFTLLTDAQLPGLARAMQEMLTRLKQVLRDPPYNFILHTAPPQQERPGRPEYWCSVEHDYHWHIELVPRLAQIAGFEWGSGFHINPTSPEDAALFLRGDDL